MPGSPRPITLALAAACVLGAVGCSTGDERTGELPAADSLATAAEAVDSGVAEAGDESDEAAPPGDPSPAGALEARVDTTAGESGVVGQATVGPRCPVQEVGRECPSRPYSTRLAIRSLESGRVVTSVTSDPNGAFRVELEPGEYVLEPEPPELVQAPRAEAVSFTVEEGRFTRITIRFDTGIR